MNTYRIATVKDSAQISNSEFEEVEAGTCLLDYLVERFGADGFTIPTKIYKGSIAESCEVDINDYSQAMQAIDDNFFIIQNPLGTETLLIISLAISVATILLMPVPNLGGNGRNQKKSPNNDLSTQNNLSRLGDRVPEIFGEVKSYPDLIAPTAFEYEDNIKKTTDFVCVGRGFYDIQEVRNGETPIDNIDGSSYEVYEPSEPTIGMIITRSSKEVLNQKLAAPNDSPILTFNEFEVIHIGGAQDLATINYTGSQSGFFSVFDDSNFVDLAGFLLSEQGGPGGPVDVSATNYLINKSGTTDSSLVLENVEATDISWSLIPTGEVWELTNSGAFGEVSAQDSDKPVGSFFVPGNNVNNEIWIDIEAPQGLASGAELNNSWDVEIDFLFEEIDGSGVPTGNNFTYTVDITGNSNVPKFWTFKIGSSDGLIVDSRYQVTGTRTSDTDSGTIDTIVWRRLAGIEEVDESQDITGTTRIKIKTTANEQVTSIQDKIFNLDATRKVVTWNGMSVVGDIETGVGLTASRRMADSFLHYSLDAGLAARSESDIDIQSIYDIQNALDSVFNGEKGEFSFTFDNADTPALEEMRNISSAARCFIYREGSVFSMIRDEEQPVNRAMFNRRAKIPGSETKSLKFDRPLDADGVKIEFNDIEDGVIRTITLPNDLPVSDPNYGLPDALNPKTIDAIGVRQYSQAWDRAQYEFRKIIYQRETVKTTVSREGLLVPLNSRILHTDGTRLNKVSSDGEIRAIDGLNVTTSEECVFEEGETYSVILRSDVGDLSLAIPVSERSDSNFGFVLSNLPSFTIHIRGDNDYQRGTLYNFAPDGNDLANSYLVQRKTFTDGGNVELELINYTSEYYASDNQTPPEKT